MNRCVCILGNNPNCPVDHQAEDAARQAVRQRHAARLLADPEWVQERLEQALPYQPEATDWRAVDTRNLPHLVALVRGSDEELLAAAKAIRAGLRAIALDECESDADAEFEREQDAAEAEAARGGRAWGDDE
jgi:hypothetical protein